VIDLGTYQFAPHGMRISRYHAIYSVHFFHDRVREKIIFPASGKNAT
jgi:hypothetical protein